MFWNFCLLNGAGAVQSVWEIPRNRSSRDPTDRALFRSILAQFPISYLCIEFNLHKTVCPVNKIWINAHYTNFLSKNILYLLHLRRCSHSLNHQFLLRCWEKHINFHFHCWILLHEPFLYCLDRIKDFFLLSAGHRRSEKWIHKKTQKITSLKITPIILS